ncbi:MAG: polysaccharide biosynthesis/export family protein [Bacteroidaceae bacterium]|nr:polysaccharide biosynthesis/export family protein [Bacteroidaceae bacterium]
MKKTRAIIAAVMAAAMVSCSSYKNLAYLQDLQERVSYLVQERPEAKISVGDKLSITVTCSNPTLAAPFNVASGHSYYDATSGNVNYSAQSEESKGYLVDKNGEIDFPVLGKINVAGTTLVDLKNEIERRLKVKPYIQDPLVFVEFMNFKVTMLGEIGNGNYTFPSGEVTILEAIAEAGINNTGVIDDIWVIRTTGGERRLYSINLKTKDLYDSPVYYLQQNDLVYVKPKNGLRDSKTDNMFQNVSLVSSFVTTVTTLITSVLLYLNVKK